MAKDALIRLRCSASLKRRLEDAAARREQSLSDFVRTRLIEILPELEGAGGVVKKKPQKPPADPDP